MKLEITHIPSIFSGWSLTGIISVLLISNVILTVSILDINEKETVSILIRSTAKLSFVLFMLAFGASSIRYYTKNTVTKWLLANRRYIGVSFAISHYIHLAMLILMTVYINFNAFEDRGTFRVIVGAIGYAFITIMTLTSFNKTRNFFGARNWKPIHTIGGYFLWVLFAQAYVLNMTNPLKILFAVVAVVVFLLRVSVLFKKMRS